jgi:hypothetical protein
LGRGGLVWCGQVVMMKRVCRRFLAARSSLLSLEVVSVS